MIYISREFALTPLSLSISDLMAANNAPSAFEREQVFPLCSLILARTKIGQILCNGFPSLGEFDFFFIFILISCVCR